MKLNLKEDPNEWRVRALLTVLGLAILSSVLHWRRHLPVNFWCALLALSGFVAICAVLQPRWFRGWYHLSSQLGFYSRHFIGCFVLTTLFLFILTPLGFMLRLMGKDLLQLKHPYRATTYWNQAKDAGPLNRPY